MSGVRAQNISPILCKFAKTETLESWMVCNVLSVNFQFVLMYFLANFSYHHKSDFGR